MGLNLSNQQIAEELGFFYAKVRKATRAGAVVQA
jgi:hypothetical protein